MLELIKTYYPINEQLKQFIYCYYLISDTPDDLHNLHYSFPHTFNAVSIYKSAFVTHQHRHFTVTGNGANGQPLCLLQGKFQYPLLVELNGRISRLTILFKPLGLNQFMGQPLGELLDKSASTVNLWPDDVLNNLANLLFTESDITERLELLEKHLLDIYRPWPQPLLEKALTYLTDFTQDLTIKEIADRVNLPLRTFNRLFKMHLGVSPAAHRQIARFRHSLENKLFNEQLQKLTTIGYQSNFYDQSYFNKIYRQLSGSNPGKFFRSVHQVGDSNLVFQFVK